MTRTRTAGITSGLLALALVAAACGGDDDPLDRFGETTTINGETPPGVMARLVDVKIMLDTLNADGDRLLVTRGVREAGTRVGIHVHEWGGHTCVLSGTITDFVQDREPSTFPAGTCYYMPPNTPMSAANLGDDDAVLIDTFVFPVGGEPITILEPGYPTGPDDD